MYPECTWQRTGYDDYVRVLIDEEIILPCIYTTRGFKANNQVYIFVDSDNLSDPRHIRTLADSLEGYLPGTHSLGPNASLEELEPDSREFQQYFLMDENVPAMTPYARLSASTEFKTN
ncbi:hypothetical protein AN958_01730 [Leucoagaricus sp. SymC.cos]|nr:hypothetical protein AN958_01730 [Leucoagaricus sp. SymC.cos]